MSTKAPDTCKGMRDFYGEEVAKREYIFTILKKQFRRFGFLPLETPTMEYLQTLTGKYGDEGDQLIFKVLSSGDYISEYKKALGKDAGLISDLREVEPKKLLPFISDKALRYDLTIPFARFVAGKYRELPMPFKRYQMQPVWRADRPQKGRYREFYQCDADIIGSDSLLNEVDLLYLLDEAFVELNIPVLIKINNRKILNGIAEAVGIVDQLTDMTVAFDKLDKIGKEKVLEELRGKGIEEKALAQLGTVLDLLDKPTNEVLMYLERFLESSEVGKKGIAELKEVFSVFENQELRAELSLDVTLARGLSYYTGTIIEVKSKIGTLSSTITAGGRYDNLTGIFGVDNLSGVGISFGVDRIFDVLEENKLFPAEISKPTDVLVLNFGEREVKEMYPYVLQLRKQDVSVEIYPDPAKMKKQMKYADDKEISYVLIAGEEELSKNSVQLKNMKTGNQDTVNIEEVVRYFSKRR